MIRDVLPGAAVTSSTLSIARSTSESSSSEGDSVFLGHGNRTKKEYDSETNLTYFGARYYDSRHVRWLSPDPLVVDAAWPAAARGQGEMRPQRQLALYAYAFNSPVTFVDPDGLDPLTAAQKTQVEDALKKIATIPGFTKNATLMDAQYKAGKIEAAGATQKFLAVFAPGDPAAITEATGVTYIYDFSGDWNGFDATLVHESSHVSDLAISLALFNSDPDREDDPKSRAYVLEADYAAARMKKVAADKLTVPSPLLKPNSGDNRPRLLSPGISDNGKQSRGEDWW